MNIVYYTKTISYHVSKPYVLKGQVKCEISDIHRAKLSVKLAISMCLIYALCTYPRCFLYNEGLF